MARARRAAAPSRAARSTAPARPSPRPSTPSGRRDFKDSTGTTVNYQAVGSGGGIAQFTAGTVDFGATDAAMKPDEEAAAKKKGDPVQVPTVLGAVTVSYNLSGIDKGLKLDGETIADIFLGKVKKWNDPEIAKVSGRHEPARQRTSPSATAPTSRARRRTSPSSSPTTAGVGERPRRRQDGQVADGHGRQGQRRRGRLRQADRGRRRLRRAGLRAAEQLHDRGREEQGGPVRGADARGDVGGRRGRSTCPTTCGSSIINAPGPKAYPITAVDLPARLPGPVQGGHQAGDGQARQELARLRARATGRRSRPSCSTRRCPTPIKQKAQAKVDAMQCNG